MTGIPKGKIKARALIDAMPTPHARMVCISVLARFAGTTLYLPTVEPKAKRRQRAARHALGNGVGDADVAAMLRERFSISARTAQRDVMVETGH